MVRAPHGALPGVVSCERVLARTGSAAVCITRLAVYPAGFEFDLLTMAADEESLDPRMFHPHQQVRRRGGEGFSPDLLRLGVQFADGSKATNTGSAHYDREPPPGPVMNPASGSGGGGTWRRTLWVWPLPPAGPLAFVCEWPAMDIPLTRTELDAQQILDAAARAQVFFSDAHLPEPPVGGGSLFGQLL